MMLGLQSRLESDVVINPFSWNTVVLRNGFYYSVKHYPRGTSVTTGKFLPERFFFRYELNMRSDWEYVMLSPEDFGVRFDVRGYALVQCL